MGLFEKLRAELVDIVEWVDDSRTALVWRFPRYHNQIKQGAQLIVRPGQTAVFVHQGKVADVFGPGRHTLETKHLPVLSTLALIAAGFATLSWQILLACILVTGGALLAVSGTLLKPKAA